MLQVKAIAAENNIRYRSGFGVNEKLWQVPR
jgi:hypothetical protein